MNNMTLLLQDHTEYLEVANAKASIIYSTLDKAALSAGSWNQNFEWGGPLGRYALRILTPLTTLILGNYGLPPSFTRNAALLLGGKISVQAQNARLNKFLGMGFGELLVLFRSIEWASLVEWSPVYPPSSRSRTQQPVSDTDHT